MESNSRIAPIPGWLLTAAVLLALAVSGCGRPPQLADDPECFSAVDALWTALGSRQPELLVASETRLKKLHDEKSLSDPSFEFLQSTIDTANAGDWKVARGKLRTFMEGQRRGK